ncbi:hypothetical protein AJ79_05999 [Helicocarpus griseus UAMH5409]|uniref:CMP/dCMP-type deaminase domain-containing protein n=1 Tax=Helicocarpus griseus UAMH5409 TaxID=1447875 RepID=A0A2B7XHY3_9EURO|nr:hypothetical protein AJ79_05999 [Helicocarpus griseus UAMH5409]
MILRSLFLTLASTLASVPQAASTSTTEVQAVLANPELKLNRILFATRAYWMRRAKQALSDLGSPCPFAAFGTVIVNHTSPEELGDLICIGVNANS